MKIDNRNQHVCFTNIILSLDFTGLGETENMKSRALLVNKTKVTSPM